MPDPPIEVVKLQAFREQYRVTIPHEMVGKLKWQKGQILVISTEGPKLVLETVQRK